MDFINYNPGNLLYFYKDSDNSVIEDNYADYTLIFKIISHSEKVREESMNECEEPEVIIVKIKKKDDVSIHGNARKYKRYGDVELSKLIHDVKSSAYVLAKRYNDSDDYSALSILSDKKSR
ncbi:unnamed protein product [Cunninghamella echinulata]